MTESVDVLVAGAGPVGLTLAGQLARRGVRCLVVERAARRTDQSRALVLWPRTLELLAMAGAVEPFLAAGLAAPRARLFGHGRELACLEFARGGSPYASALMIPQSETERLLAADALAAGAELRRATELREFRAGADAVEATLRAADGGAQPVRAGWLVGCDGAHSTVRHALGLAFAGRAEDNDWFLADTHITGPLPRDEIRIDLHPDGILACFPLPPDRFRVLGDLGPARGAQPPAPTLADVQALLDRRGPGGLRAHDPVWLSGFRINERQVPRYRVGRVLLAGDAAHVHSPAGGQGMNTGMHDAFNLAWKLALVLQGRAPATLLDSYEAERRPVGALIVRGAGGMTRAATLRRPAAQRLRDLVVSGAYSLDAVRDLAARLLTETAIGYRRSPIVRDARPWTARLGTARVRAGDRAPDAPLVDAAGAPTTLFAQLRDPRHTLLVLSADRPDDAPALAAAVTARFPGLVRPLLVGRDATAAALDDVEGLLHARYAAHAPTAVVLRPDGYVGYIGPAEAERVCGFLGSYLAEGG